ncbi:diguanylate cyclase [Altererythrobacter xixiisoli]|uniref:diguanylate cyclase n=1 Tax=Croceibacterium xixiisoli TaxID=1476466 RepID=A0A6I4TPW8_9SPHN|nr:GGDEF domain-containing protein [Croceibacterium xixiisoli]MXO97972.1 diguanylate cyclase [Croceibacterium xixiisoli]
MSPTQRIWLWTAFSVTVTLIPMSVMTRLPGLGIPLPYWIFALLCSGVTSFFVAHKLIHQGERLRILHAELVVAHEKLGRIAMSDSLTQVLNRGAFLDHVKRRHAGGDGWLLLVDADHFKSINDRFGHEAGDDALQSIVGIMRQVVRTEDPIGRLGGEEFGIYLSGMTEQDAIMIAERIRQRIEQADLTDRLGNSIPLSVSIGVTRMDPMDKVRDSLRLADNAMYQAKHNGRNQVILSN